VHGVKAVDDTAACALALRLKGLQDLCIKFCGLRSAAALPVIANLTGLTALELTSQALATDELPLGQEELQLLRPLTQLKSLCAAGFIKDAAVAELWDKGRRQWRQQHAQQ
jgi:hypothetical protein